MSIEHTTPRGYVYLITHYESGTFYYGSRTANITKGILPIDDLWKIYFTHSKEIARLIDQYGKDSFEYSIVFESRDTDEVFWSEQEFIKENIGKQGCLNKHYFDRTKTDKVFSFAGKKHTEEAKRKQGTVPWTAGLTKETDERLKRISEKFTGEGNPWYGKVYSEEERKQMSELTTGILRSEETKQRMRKPKSKEHADNISSAALKRPRFPCAVCGRLITKANIENHKKVHQNDNTTI